MEPTSEMGRYRLLERLSDGDVWLAEDQQDTRKQVVVKFVPPEADVLGYQQQGIKLKALDKDGIVTPIDSAQAADGRAFFVFPYIGGNTLRQVLNEGGPMSFPRASGILREIGRLLTVAHEKHFAHGALDPEHILILHEQGKDSVFLINFGTWRLSLQPSTPLGYLAPESGTGQAHTSADIFSLAAIAAELLTGRRAFRYGSENDLRRLQRIGMPRGALRKLRSSIPTRAEDEIRRGLAYDPLHRPGDAEVFADRIASSLAERAKLPLRRAVMFAVLMAGVAGASAYRACRQR